MQQIMSESHESRRFQRHAAIVGGWWKDDFNILKI
jgi:hypothetical protein